MKKRIPKVKFPALPKLVPKAEKIKTIPKIKLNIPIINKAPLRFFLANLRANLAFFFSSCVTLFSLMFFFLILIFLLCPSTKGAFCMTKEKEGVATKNKKESKKTYWIYDFII